MPKQIVSRPLIAVLTTFFALVVLTVWSCTQEQSGGDHQTQKGDMHFGYEGEVGPEYWGALKPEYALCGTGRKQSPIDITKPASADLPALTLNYHPTALKIINGRWDVSDAEGELLRAFAEKYDIDLKKFK